MHSTWLWLGASGRTWAIHCSEDQTQITFNVTCPLVVHFLSNLLLNLCRVHTAAAAYCSLFPSESHTLLNQMPYEGYYFSIIILVNKTIIFSRKEIKCYLARPVFSKTNLSNIRCVSVIYSSSLKTSGFVGLFDCWPRIAACPTCLRYSTIFCLVKYLHSSGLRNFPNISRRF